MRVSMLLFNNGNTSASFAFQSFVEPEDRPDNLLGLLECYQPDCSYTPEQFGITQFPTIVFLGQVTAEEGKPVSKMTGAFTRETILAELRRLSLLPPPFGTDGAGGKIPGGDGDEAPLGFGVPFAWPSWVYLVSGIVALKEAADAESTFGRVIYGAGSAVAFYKYSRSK